MSLQFRLAAGAGFVGALGPRIARIRVVTVIDGYGQVVVGSG